MKLLVVNLQNPGDTKYRNPKTIESFILGRRISNYPMFIVDNDFNISKIELKSPVASEIQKTIDLIFKKGKI